MRDRAANANVHTHVSKDELVHLRRWRANLYVCSGAVHCFGIVIYNENTNSKLRAAHGGVEDHRLNGLLRKREPLRP